MDVMYNMMTVDDPAARYMEKLRVNSMSSHHMENFFPFFLCLSSG